MLGAFISVLVGTWNKQARDICVCVVAGVEFFVMLGQGIGFFQYGVEETLTISSVCGMGLSFILDGFRSVYGLVAAFMWLMTALFSPDYFKHYHHRNRYYFFFLMTLGATMGVFLSADLFTTFIFFEIMSFTSYVWVAQDEKPESLRAAQTYLAVAVMGGLVMLMGLFLLYNAVGTLTISALPNVCAAYENRTRLYVAGACMLFGFGAKAGAFPLHIWLPKAHPVAPAPASALLSGILTKSGIYGILVVTCSIFVSDTLWGRLLMVLGVITMVWGAVLALFSNNLKRTLACSSMSQIGFILVGIAASVLTEEGRAEAVRGTLLHMVNHSLIKLVLFMAAGVVFMNLHELDLNKIRGFGRKKPLLHICFLLGAVSIAGIPFVGSGYISKTLLHEGLVAYGSKAIEWIFLFSGGCTVAYMTKLYLALFWERNADLAAQKRFDAMKHYMHPVSAAALTVSAIVLPVMGLFPKLTMDKVADLEMAFMKLSEAEDVSYFSLENMKGGVISIAIGVVVYLVFVRLLLMKKEGAVRVYVNRFPAWMDLENVIYRPLLTQILPFICGVLCRVLDSLVDGVVVLLRATLYRDRKIPGELEEGTAFTAGLGQILDHISGRLRAWRGEEPRTFEQTYTHRLAMLREDVEDTSSTIGRSMSYGLLLFGLGLFITVGYLLFAAR
jgi:hydrogenase-4 component B